MEQIKQFFEDLFTENPHYFGFFIVFVGVLVLLAAIFDWNWLFGNVSGVTYNLKKIDGWVNWFGRRNARIISGVFAVLLILGGLFWFLLYAFYFK
jgi:uncharacterized membrane protein YidH (DUF202 family)